MLQQLSKQIISVSSECLSKPQIIIVYNSDDVNETQIEQIVNTELKHCLSLIDLKIISAPGLHYYEIKNFGAKYCDRDVIIFLDTDVIPNDFWLPTILKSFKQPEISVIGGQAYIVPHSIYEKAFAWFWYFPSKLNDSEDICESNHFWANNVAFRRETFLENTFPVLPQFRGQCVSLSESLQKKGIKIFENAGAIVDHPAPNGLKHFVKRALAAGHDKAVIEKRSRPTKFDGDRKNYQRKKIFSELKTRYTELGLTPPDAMVGISIVFSYFFVKYIGYFLASINPKIIRKHVSV